MHSDEIDEFFRKKYEYLNEFIHKADGAASVMPNNRIEKPILVMHANVLRNIKDLYYLHETTFRVIGLYKTAFDDLQRRTIQTEEIAKNSKERFDTTLGSLEARLKKISEEDAKEQEKLGDSSFYG